MFCRRNTLLTFVGLVCLPSSPAESAGLRAEEPPSIGQYFYEPGPERRISGTVRDAKGNLVPAARVYFFGDQWTSSPHPTQPTLELGRAVSDGQGKFDLSIRPLRLASHKLCVIAEGHGMDFRIIDPLLDDVSSLQVTLPEERVFQGTIAGPNGEPAPNVTFQVWSVNMDTPFYQNMSYSIGKDETGKRPIEIQSDAEGNFTLRGLPKTLNEIWFRCDDERYAPMECNRFGGETARFQDGVVKIDRTRTQTITLQLSAPRFVTGIVRSKEAMQPMAGAWVGVVVANWSTPGDSHSMAIWGKTDAAGRFRIRCGAWGENLCVYAFAPQGLPYPDWSIGAIPWPEGKTELDVMIEMPIGTMVRGRVLEEGTKKPIARASLIYMVRREKPRTMDNESASRIYWSNEYHQRYTAADGSFEQPVASGEVGVIMVKAPNGNYVSEYLTNGDIQFEKPGGLWYLVEGWAKVVPDGNARELKVDILMTLGTSATGTATGPQGETIRRGYIIRDIPRHMQDIQINGPVIWGELIVDGKFRVEGCDPNRETIFYFLDSEHQRGATFRFDPKNESELSVTLKPCGSVRFRAIDAAGKPLKINPFYTTPRMELALTFRKAPPDDKYIPSLGNIQASISVFDFARYHALKPDPDGLITFPGLIPGAPYTLLIDDGKPRLGKRMPEQDFEVKPGQTLDLGDLMLK